MVSHRCGPAWREHARLPRCPLALFVAALYYGVHIGGVYWRYYQLLDDMRQQAIFAAPDHRRRHPVAG